MPRLMVNCAWEREISIVIPPNTSRIKSFDHNPSASATTSHKLPTSAVFTAAVLTESTSVPISNIIWAAFTSNRTAAAPSSFSASSPAQTNPHSDDTDTVLSNIEEASAVVLAITPRAIETMAANMSIGMSMGMSIAIDTAAAASSSRIYTGVIHPSAPRLSRMTIPSPPIPRLSLVFPPHRPFQRLTYRVGLHRQLPLVQLRFHLHHQ